MSPEEKTYAPEDRSSYSVLSTQDSVLDYFGVSSIAMLRPSKRGSISTFAMSCI